GVLIGPLSRWLGEQRLTMLGIGLVLAGYLLVSLAQPEAHAQGPMAQPAIYSAAVLMAMGIGVTAPSLRAMISRRLDAGSQGRGLGSLQALQSLGTSIGPPVAGVLFTSLAPRAPFWVAIVVLVIVAALTSGALQRQRSR
ncbi:MAG: MFS transporter, partial [Synechococcus sp. SB0672_bin_6]|nr:MFS transporter [Synechococcus sp. SB0672_bin_6]